MEGIRILFVHPKLEASEVMMKAFEICKNHVDDISWVKAADLMALEFTKTDFVVFQDFLGEAFDKIKTCKCARIVGPLCVSICLTEGRPIPNLPYPIYNVAMSDVVLSCSHLNRKKKDEIKDKVQLMGGVYSDALVTKTTHLVTDSVQSEKYAVAVEKGYKVVLPQWMNEIWEASQTRNVSPHDAEFEKFRCPPLYNLTISTTGLTDKAKRSELAAKIDSNGGCFSAAMNLERTNILIVVGERGLLSEKYKAASRGGSISCVNLSWLDDSIRRGATLPVDNYKVTSVKITSTPTKAGAAFPDFSIISTIGGDAPTRATFDETDLNNLTRTTTIKRKSNEMDGLVDNLDVKKAKRAGEFLDGCSIYIAGFDPDQRDKLCKVLNSSGATRHDAICDRLTHVIVGDPSCPELKLIQSKNYPASLVSIHWLLESVELQRPADEDNFLIDLHECSKTEGCSSPLTQKGLHLLRSNRVLTEIQPQDDSEHSEEDSLMKQYTQFNQASGDSLAQLLKDNNFETNELASQSGQWSPIFQDRVFRLLDLDPETRARFQEGVKLWGGKLVGGEFQGELDFLVARPFLEAPVRISALEIVNEIYLEELLQREELIDIEYYHRPLVIIAENQPLRSYVVTISTYTGKEREFLRELVEKLGGVSQDQLARVDNEKRNLKATTHLLTSEAEGKKYTAAVKWGVPVVDRHWLTECGSTGRLVAVEKFLVGQSRTSVSKVDLTTSRTLQQDCFPSNVQEESLPSTSASISDLPPKSPFVKNFPEGPLPSTSASSSDLRPKSPFFKTAKEESWKTDRTDTPEQPPSPKTQQTPPNRNLFREVDTPGCSQVTPVHKIMEEARKNNLLGTPERRPIPRNWFIVDTPPSPFGKGIDKNMSAESKKELLRYINHIPDYVPLPERRLSTPLSEVKRRCLNRLLGREKRTEEKSQENDENVDVNRSSSEGSSPTNSDSVFINTKLKQMEEFVNSSRNSSAEKKRTSRGAVFQSTIPAEFRDMPDSQPFSVKWQYTEEERDGDHEQETQKRIFLISGIENEKRHQLKTKIESLEGLITESPIFCTHLICEKPNRNEKVLSCMAGGKWILHSSYVERSVSAGRFLNEDEFEFGNPKFLRNLKLQFDRDTTQRMEASHWWRREINKRGYGAFRDMRAIVVAPKKDAIVNVIKAGGGVAIDAEPPFDSNVDATHCLLEIKSVSDYSPYYVLAERGVSVVSSIFISDYLSRVVKEVKDAVLPQFLSMSRS